MRRLSAVLFALWWLFTAPVALADGVNWSIESFDVTIRVRADGVIEVRERIVADFTREQHRGILRDIPYVYRRHGTNFHLRMDVTGVTDDAGNEHPYESWRGGGQLHLRIGDPNIWLSRKVVYNIDYTVKRGLLGFDTHDELYWNATGTEWPVPIADASCTVILPQGAVASPQSVRTASFVGPRGSRRTGPDGQITDEGAIVFDHDQPLGPWQGMTIVVGWQPGYVETPNWSTRVGWFLADNSILLVPVIVFVLLWLLWRLVGRDRGRPGTVTVHYGAPDGLSPVEIGAIIDERVDNADITASIIDLAIRGYIRIDAPLKSAKHRPSAKRTTLIRTSKSDRDLKPFEQRLLTGLFADGDEVVLDDLEMEFYPVLDDVRSQVYKGLSKDGYFAGHFPFVRSVWAGLGIMAAFVSAAVFMGLLVGTERFAPLSVIIAGVLTVPQFPIFARHMPRKTLKGRRTFEKIKGLEEYITRAELEDLELAAKRARFETLLPHAMALGLSHVWAKHFSGLYERPPAWFDTHLDSGPTPLLLARHVNYSRTVMNRTLGATPRTSSSGSSWSSGGFGGGSSGFSGGSSGGGGGGGGGGAW